MDDVPAPGQNAQILCQVGSGFGGLLEDLLGISA